MRTRGVVDVVFCLDASDSMSPCIEAVKRHIVDFVTGLQSKQQKNWDLRLDFVAHSASASPGPVYRHKSALIDEVWDVLYQGSPGQFFVRDPSEFQKGLGTVVTTGDEASLVALDFCLDFPWRPAGECHRVVIFMTDEALETGVLPDFQAARVEDLIRKIQQSHVMLFIVAPQSATYDRLAAVQHCEYQLVESSGTGLSDVDFAQVLQYAGASVSRSALQARTATSVQRGLFGQSSWTRSSRTFEGLTGR